MESILPTPLVAPEVDLRDVRHMPLDVSKMRMSKAYIGGKRRPQVFFAAFSLMTAAWTSVPAASLVADDEILADIAGVSLETWQEPGFREAATQDFVLCSDGLIYHRDLSELANAEWDKINKRNAYIEKQRAHGRKAHLAAVASKTKPIGAETKPAPQPAPEAVPSPENFALVAFDPVVASALEEAAEAKNAAAHKADIEQVFSTYQALISPRSRLDKKRKELILRRLTVEKFTAQDLCRAIVGCSKSAFHMGDNDRGTKYNGLDLILRDASYVEKFMALAEGPVARVASSHANSAMAALEAVFGNDDSHQTLLPGAESNLVFDLEV